MSTPDPHPETLDFDDVAGVITAFGGLTALASAIGVPVNTAQGWKERGKIPAARHRAIEAAYAARDDGHAEAPVEHAIDAAAHMEPARAPRANAQTRAYYPPQSQQSARSNGNPSAGGSNLILGLILLVLFGVVGLQSYMLYATRDSGAGPDLTELRLSLATSQAQNEAAQQQAQTLAEDVATQLQGVDTRLETLETTLSGLGDVEAQLTQIGETLIGALAQEAAEVLEAGVTDASGQLRDLAAGLTTAAQDQAMTFNELALAQTALFEVLSQDLQARMDTIAANVDSFITDQIARLELRAVVAEAEAEAQRALAVEALAQVEAVEAQLDNRAQAAAAEVSALVALIDLRLALAQDQPFAAGLAALEARAAGEGELEQALTALATLADTPAAREGAPSLLALLEHVDALLLLDRQEVVGGQGGLVVTVPASDDLTSNQGRLTAARAALIAQDYERAHQLVENLEAGAAAQAATDLRAGIAARQATQTASQALDRWLSARLQAAQ